MHELTVPNLFEKWWYKYKVNFSLELIIILMKSQNIGQTIICYWEILMYLMDITDNMISVKIVHNYKILENIHQRILCNSVLGLKKRKEQ